MSNGDLIQQGSVTTRVTISDDETELILTFDHPVTEMRYSADAAAALIGMMLGKVHRLRDADDDSD